MSIRVQCDGCDSVMTVRDDYAGTERRCPKCKAKFRVPTLEEARQAAAKPSAGVGEDFDPVAFLTGEQPKARTKVKSKGAKAAPEARSATSAPGKSDFDPMDVLADEAASPKKPDKPASGASAEPKPPAPSMDKPIHDDFDPMAVLGDAPAKPRTPPPASSPPAAAAEAPPESRSASPGEPEKPQPRRPSWAKPLPEPEKPDWLEPGAAPPSDAAAPTEKTAPEKPQPRRPSWAKPLPEPEKPDWLEPGAEDGAATSGAAQAAAETPAAPKPKRPSWAKPLPGEEGQPTAAGTAAPDASPAAQAAAAAMSTVTGVSSENPALQAPRPKRKIFDRQALAAWFRRRLPLLAKTTVTAAILFGLSWKVVKPTEVVWQEIGRNQKLNLVPVQGTITVDGKPVPNARVLFHPRGPQFRSPEGCTDSEGRYRLRFCEGYDGAPPGRYRVHLQLIDKDGRDSGTAADALLREKTFEVPPGGGAVDITLSTKSKP